MSSLEQPQPFDHDLEEASIVLPPDDLIAHRIVSAAVLKLSPHLDFEPSMVPGVIEPQVLTPPVLSPREIAKPVPHEKLAIQDTIERAVEGLREMYGRFSDLQYDRFPLPIGWLERYLRWEARRGNIVISQLTPAIPNMGHRPFNYLTVITGIEKNRAQAYDPISDSRGFIEFSTLRQYAARMGLGNVWTPVQVIGYPLGRLRKTSGSR